MRDASFRGNEITTSHYTARNFLFKNLFQQFQRAANVYFLVIGVLQLDVFFPGLSPTHWSTTIGPLLVVLSINAVKEAVDDYGRHKSDAEVNARTVEVVRVAGAGVGPSGRGGAEAVDVERVAWRDLRVGDVARVRADHEIPADLLLVASSDRNGLAFVETANLDGETNLKVKCVAPVARAQTKKGRETEKALGDPLDATALRRVLGGGARLECEAPNNQLYKFEGKWIARSGDDEMPERDAEAAVSSREKKVSRTARRRPSRVRVSRLSGLRRSGCPRTTCCSAARRCATPSGRSAWWSSPAATPS